MACRSSVRYSAALASAAAAWLARICRSSSSSSLKASPWPGRARRAGPCGVVPRRRAPPDAAPPASSRRAGASAATARRRSSSSSACARPRRRPRRRRPPGSKGTNASPRRSSTVDGAAGDAEQPGDLPPHLAEHGVDVERGDQHAARLEQRREPPVLALAAPVQPRVADGDRGLLAERARELDFRGAEDPLPSGLDEHQDPERLALDDERHVEAGLLSPPLHGRRTSSGSASSEIVSCTTSPRSRSSRSVGSRPGGRRPPPPFPPAALRAVERAAHDGVSSGFVLVDHALGVARAPAAARQTWRGSPPA